MFMKALPSELVRMDIVPSSPFLALVHANLDTKRFNWIPWRLRSSAFAEERFLEQHCPRTDAKLLTRLLQEGQPEEVCTASVPHFGPAETLARWFWDLVIYAIAPHDAAHLLHLGKAAAKFLSIALATPSDRGMRPPSLQEIAEADRALWVGVASIQSERGQLLTALPGLASGARVPVTSALLAINCDCFPPVDLIIDASRNILDDDFFALLCRVADAGLVGTTLAAPVCSLPSILSLCPGGGGPLPLHDFVFPSGRSDLSWEESEKLQVSAMLHDRSHILLSRVGASGGLIMLADPASSLTFHDPLMMDWIACEDGGGIHSTANWLQPAAPDIFFEAFQASPAEQADLLFIAPGQPLRLRRLKFLLQKILDSEAPLCDQWESGGAWQPADSAPDIVHSLLEEERRESWITVYASLDVILKEFPQVALGRLGLVLAEGRPPRLVADSSISGVTSSSVIPNHVSNPRLQAVSSCAPSFVPSDPWIDASVDVKKARRRMKIAQHDRALLAFSFGGRQFVSNCLRFGVRALSWYWASLADAIHRVTHYIIFLRHFLWVYADDLSH
ncbi:unnamed protein product [Symbiodinium sp. CCMP2456]|nr:unnamed protein product [Symbiodinium sp. CCMP2456]